MSRAQMLDAVTVSFAVPREIARKLEDFASARWLTRSTAGRKLLEDALARHATPGSASDGSVPAPASFGRQPAPTPLEEAILRQAASHGFAPSAAAFAPPAPGEREPAAVAAE